MSDYQVFWILWAVFITAAGYAPSRRAGIGFSICALLMSFMIGVSKLP